MKECGDSLLKILWVSASIIGPASRILSKQYVGSSGGWIQSEYESLSASNVEMYFLCPSSDVMKGKVLHATSDEGEAYCVKSAILSYGIGLSKRTKKDISKVIGTINPDIIHIWGTESNFTTWIASSFPSIKKVIFVQGLIGIHNRYYGGYLKALDEKGIQRNKSAINLMKNYLKKRMFYSHIKYEKEAIKKASHVITDNKFTIAYVKSIDNNIKIYDKFLLPNKEYWLKEWDYEKCEKGSIFTVYGISPDKGLHQLLKAIRIVKKSIANIKVYIPGNFQIDNDGRLVKSRKMTSYEIWLYEFIKKYDLQENIIFVGKQDIHGMIHYLCRANIFVNPSCMEVHALSLREALMVGVPSISSMCGSVNEYMVHNSEGLIYRYEEHEILAHYILELFQDTEFAEWLGNRAREKMLKNSKANTKSLIDIYSNIMD